MALILLSLSVIHYFIFLTNNFCLCALFHVECIIFSHYVAKDEFRGHQMRYSVLFLGWLMGGGRGVQNYEKLGCIINV